MEYESEATYVIVGGGIAGVTCVETLAILQPEEKLVIITASSMVKNISNVSFYAKTIVKFDVNETQASHLMKIHPNTKIIFDSVKDINTTNKVVTTSGGHTVKYRVMCLCSGGIPRLPITDSRKHQRILGIRDTESINSFQERLKNGRRMLVIGNGGIASEIIHETKGIQKVWVVRDDYISATFVDPGAAEFFQDSLKNTKAQSSCNEENTVVIRRHVYNTEEDTLLSLDKNLKSAALGPDWYRKLEDIKTEGGGNELEIIYNTEVTSVKELICNDYPLEVELSNGRVLTCDFLISATGVEPAVNYSFDAKPEIGPDGGINVNEMQESSIPDVFAAGDVAHAGWQPAAHWFQLRLWTQAMQMAAMAAKAMHAKINNQEIYQDFSFELFTHCTTLFGYRVVLLGKYNGQGLGSDYEILLRTSPGLEYIKFVIQNGRLQGAILIGETDLEEMCENLILDQIDLTPFGDDILNPDIDIDDYFD